jgi:hypothetical protein
MKQGVHLILCVIVGLAYYQAFNYLGLPFWAHVVTAPVLIYLMIFATNVYSFRISLDLEEIPARGYAGRVKDLKENERMLARLGFRKFDEFYFRIAADAVVYAYSHESRPIILCDYHLGGVRCCDLVTNFENGFSLTTSNAASAGNIPRPPKKMLQIFDGRAFDELDRQHWQGIEFLKQRNFRCKPWRVEEFRRDFLRAFLSERENTIKLLSPLKLLYWMATNHKFRYMRPIQQQFLAKTLELPQR